MNASRSARSASLSPFCTEAKSPLERSSAAIERLAAASRASDAPPSAMRMRRDATPLLICSSRSCWVGVAEGGRNAPRSATMRVRASCQTLSAMMTSQRATASRGRSLLVMQDRHYRAVAGGLYDLDLLQARTGAGEGDAVDAAPDLRTARREPQAPGFARPGKFDAVMALELGKIAGERRAHTGHQRADRGLLAQRNETLLALRLVDERSSFAVDAEELIERRLHVLRQAVRPLIAQASLQFERTGKERDMPRLDEAALARRYL